MELTECQIVWQFANEAFKGVGGFLDGRYIERYPRESDEKYQERQRIAHYVNLFAPKVHRYVGYIFKNTPTRSGSNAIIKKIFDDCDNRGDTIDVFMSNFAKMAKVRGCALLLVDAPRSAGDAFGKQMKGRNFPYFVAIEPERVLRYKMDYFGRFEFIAYSDIVDNSTLENENRQEIIKYFDKTEWRIYDTNYNLLESGSHDLGVCPVLLFSESGEFPTLGEFTQIAFLAKRHYNLLSELDEILRSETFPVLTLNADNPTDVEIKLATDNAIAYQSGMQRPEFIAPPSAPAEVYLQKIKDVEAQIDKIAYDISTNQSQESGIALDLKFQGLNASLSNFALRLEDLENRAFEVVCRYLGIEDDVIVNYPSNFSIVDVQKEIEILSEMKQLVDVPTYFRLKAAQIISNDLNTIDPEDFAKIEAEIEDGLKS